MPVGMCIGHAYIMSLRYDMANYVESVVFENYSIRQSKVKRTDEFASGYNHYDCIKKISQQLRQPDTLIEGGDDNNSPDGLIEGIDDNKTRVSWRV